jgi:hypothetical protein
MFDEFWVGWEVIVFWLALLTPFAIERVLATSVEKRPEQQEFYSMMRFLVTTIGGIALVVVAAFFALGISCAVAWRDAPVSQPGHHW